MIKFSRSRLPEAPIADSSDCHAPDPPAAEANTFWREVLDTTISYMKWLYGGVGVSVIAYVAYIGLKKIF